MKQYTKIIADYLSNLKYEDIPAEVIERAKLVTLHTVGAAIAARVCHLPRPKTKKISPFCKVFLAFFMVL